MRKLLFPKVRGAISEKGLSHGTLAKMMGLTPANFSLRMTGKRSFKREEIQEACKILEKPESIFFD